MRRHRGIDDIDLPNEKEIERALSAAVDRPLDDLLSIEEFAEKYVVPVPAAAEPIAEELVADPSLEESDTILLPLPDEGATALPRAA